MYSRVNFFLHSQFSKTAFLVNRGTHDALDAFSLDSRSNYVNCSFIFLSNKSFSFYTIFFTPQKVTDRFIYLLDDFYYLLGRMAALYWSFEMIHVFIMFFFPNRVFTNGPNILLILSILSCQFFSKHLILSRLIYSPNVLTVCLLLWYFLGFRINFLEDLEVCIWVYQYEVLDRLIQKIKYKFNFIFHRFKS